MRTSDTTAKLDAVLAKVQASIGDIEKNKRVEVEGERAKWSSDYTTLAALDAAVRPALSAHGVTIVQGCSFVQGPGLMLSTRASFEGEFIVTEYPVKASREGAQPAGVGDSVASIREAKSREEFAAAAAKARGAHPTGEPAVAIEKAIETWLVSAYDAAQDSEIFVGIVDVSKHVQPRGSEVRAAYQRANARLGTR